MPLWHPVSKEDNVRKSLILPFLLFVLLVFAACRLDSHTTFSTPNSGTLEISWSMTQDEESVIKQATQMDAQQLCNKFKEDLDDPKAKVKFSKKGDEKICTVTAPFKSVNELKNLYGDDVTINRIGEGNGKFYYDVEVKSANGSDAASLGLEVKSTWRVTMPGKVISSNGDEVKGRTVIWNLPSSGSRHLTAVSKVGGASSVLLIAAICIGAFVLLLIVAVIVWLVLRSKKKNPEPPPAEF